MTIRSQLIRFSAAVFFAVAIVAVGFMKPANAAIVGYTNFASDSTPSLIDTIITGSNPLLLSMRLLPNVAIDAVDGGLYGSISVDVGTSIMTFVADGLPFADPTALEVGVIPGSGILTFLLPANGSYHLLVTALLTAIDATFIDDGKPILQVITNEVTNAVPVPGALPLFATGLGALGFLHWRRKRRAQAA